MRLIPPLSLSVYLSVYLFIYLSFYIYLYIFLSVSIYLSFYLFIFFSFLIFIYLSILISIYLSFSQYMNIMFLFDYISINHVYYIKSAKILLLPPNYVIIIAPSNHSNFSNAPCKVITHNSLCILFGISSLLLF